MIGLITFFTRHVIIRYLISGGTAAVTQLSIFYITNNIYSINYLVATSVAFIGAFIVSFSLHRFWTFRNDSSAKNIFIHKQAVLYLLTTSCGLLLNNLLMYTFVHFFDMNKLIAQVIVMGLVACCSFFVSRNFVFKYKKEHHIE